MDRDLLRATFNEDAELYDRVRPVYPAHLFDDLARLSDIGPRSRVLEVGAGTGRATVPLAQRGAEIVAVELGAEMAAVARRNLDRFPNAHVVVSTFEDWPLPPTPFDTLVSATAWHWIDPAIRLEKAADALHPGGTLALITTDHVAGGDGAFFEEAQACYLRWDLETQPGFHLPAAEQVPSAGNEMAGSARFAPPTVQRYLQDITYTAREYVDLLRSYSGTRALTPERRDGLLTCLAGLIDDRYGGRITKRYLHQLAVARRRE